MMIALLLSTLRDTVEAYTFSYREGLNRTAFAVTVQTKRLTAVVTMSR
jgi:hypothetical protein